MGQVIRLYHKSLDTFKTCKCYNSCVYIAMLRCLKMNHLVSSNESTNCSADGWVHNEKKKGMLSMLVGSLCFFFFFLWFFVLFFLYTYI